MSGHDLDYGVPCGYVPRRISYLDYPPAPTLEQALATADTVYGAKTAEYVERPAEAPRQMILTQDAAERKATPIATGVLDYFPLAMAYISRISKAGNDQHNPGQPLHWDKTKSTDHADCIVRHLIDRGTVDPSDGLSHTGKLAWRALALLETELGNGT